jgi:hypothetical protein
VSGALTVRQMTRAFRFYVTPPPVRLRVRADATGCRVDIPSASAGYAGIHPRNDPVTRLAATRHLEERLSRSLGTPVIIESAELLRGNDTVRVTVKLLRPCELCGGHREVVAGHDCPRCGGTGREPGRAAR